MTTLTVRRCAACGRHRAPEEYRTPRVKRCLECEARRRGRTAPLEAPSSPTGADAPAIAARVEAGTATWHQCDGADVHPAHRETHEAGFWTEGHRVIAFIEGYCVYPEGDLMGQPAVVMPWCREAIFELYRLRESDGLRQYRRAYIGVGKKNAKTVLGGWLGLYHTVADDEPTPKNVCAAANDDQADLVYEAAKATAEQGAGARDAKPGLNLGTLAEPWEREILVPDRPGASLRRLASGGGNLDGPNLYVRILDELHEWTTNKNQDTYTVLSQGGALRRQPLFIQLTTAGWDQDSLCYRVYEHAKKVQDDQSVDVYLFALIYESPEVDADGEPSDHRSREWWETANPAAGYTVTFERYLEDLEDPEMTEATARRYRGNQWTDTVEVWLPQPWAAYLAPAPFRVRPADEAAGIRTVASIDAATKRDSTVITWWEAEGTDDEMRVRSQSRVWERPTGADGKPVEGWRLPQAEVKAHAYSLHFGTTHEDETWCRDGVCVCCGEAFEPLGLESFGYDPGFGFWAGADAWEEDGLPMIEIRQTDERAVPGYQLWFRLMTEDRYQHDGDAVVERHVRNSVVRQARTMSGERIERRSTSQRRANDATVTQWMNAYLLTAPPAGSSYKPRVFVFGEDEEDGDDA